MLARSARVLSLSVFIALAGLLTGLRIASAEYNQVYQPPYYLQGYTSSIYSVYQGNGVYNYQADAYSQSYYCTTSCSLSTPYYLGVEARAYNSDLGWHLVDDEAYQCGSSPDYGYPFIRNYCTQTNTVTATAWSTLPGHYPSFYVTSWHTLIPYSGYPTMVTYTSDDGTRSTNACFSNPGC